MREGKSFLGYDPKHPSEAVKEIQRLLNQILKEEYGDEWDPIPETGIFDEETLEALALFELLYASEYEVITLNETSGGPSVTITSPSPNSIAGNAVVVHLQSSVTCGIVKVKYYYRKQGSSTRTWIGESNVPPYFWDSWLIADEVEGGNYEIVAEGYDSSNNLLATSSPVPILIVRVTMSASDYRGNSWDWRYWGTIIYIHYNIDDDNENNVRDYAENGNVKGEDEWRGLYLNLEPSSLSVGIVELERSSTAIRVWKSNKQGLLVGTNLKSWDLSDPNQREEFRSLGGCYVEGYEKSNASLTLRYKKPGGTVVSKCSFNYKCVAATCGRQPTTNEQYTWSNFKECEWSITAEADPNYNCIAYTVDEYNQVYTPIEIDREYGDGDGNFEVEDMDAFYLEKKGWRPIGSRSDAKAIYYSGFHAAKGRYCGCMLPSDYMYESKLGWQNPRAEHVYDQLDSVYGSRIRYYK